MDRIDFSKSINVDPVLQVEKFFDEVMAMYNLVEGVNYDYIHGLVHDENATNINFIIAFKSIDNAIVARDNLVGNIIQIYNRIFRISGDVTTNGELEICLEKM